MAIDDKELSKRSLIEHGEMYPVGRLVDASNATLLCTIADGDDELQVIYKPIAGERPLWDFPDGNLASREVAAYYISEVGGFNLVPFTVLREGPFGIGSVQEWIEVDGSIDLTSYGQSDDPKLRSLALLDAVLNNTDRKYGHLLVDGNGSLFGCDHGVTLHSDPKLRTVLWQWSGEVLSESERIQLKSLKEKLDRDYLETLISPREFDALLVRINDLLEADAFPEPSDDWPAVPWPPF